MIHTLAVGGAERHVSMIANYMNEHGVDVKIVLIDNGIVKFPLNDGVEVIDLQAKKEAESARDRRRTLSYWMDNLSLKLSSPTKKTYLDTKLYLKNQYVGLLEKELKQYPDAIIIPCMTVPNLVTMMATKSLHNRVVFVEFTSPAHEFPEGSAFIALRKRYYRRAQGGIFQTDEAAAYYEWLPDIQKAVIPNILNSAALPEAYHGERRRDIVNFCRLHPVKNIPLLMRAFKRIYEEYPEYTLTIYGEGSIRGELERQAAGMGLSDVIRFCDYDPHIHETVRDAAMFVSSSDREGISNSMIEAMAVGLPTVCTDCPAGGARMMITDHENGLLTPVGDETALYTAMKELIDNPTLAQTLSEKAVKIRDELTVDAIGEQWLKALDWEEQA